jgi:bifunctional non-homologous end joining protein LigD
VTGPHGLGMFEAAEGMGLEGIVSKRAGSKYRSGRSGRWLKIKCYAEEELFVVGTEQGVGPTTALLARKTEDGLEYAGGAMLTPRESERDRFWAGVDALKRDKPPLRMEGGKKARWTEPLMKVRVRTLRGEEKLRHATELEIEDAQREAAT